MTAAALSLALKVLNKERFMLKPKKRKGKKMGENKHDLWKIMTKNTVMSQVSPHEHPQRKQSCEEHRIPQIRANPVSASLNPVAQAEAGVSLLFLSPYHWRKQISFLSIPQYNLLI